jgi:hypothetical protein
MTSDLKQPGERNDQVYESKETLHRDRRRPFSGQVTLLDGIVVLCFALFALVYFLGQWRGMQPFVFLGGDAANIAGFAAARDHPELFVGDEVLGDPGNFRFYSTVHLPLIRALARVTGDYGSAFVYLLAPHVFIQALGFYIFGRVMFKSRYWAVLLAVVTLMPIRLNLGEYWGIYPDPQPRFAFQAFLPYMLSAAVVWRSRPAFWPLLLGIAGALTYVHPVGVPAWGLAIWLGLWAFQPASWSFTKRLGYMLLVGVIFLAVTFPFLAHYLQNHTHGVTTNYDQVYEIMELRFNPGFLDIPTALREFILTVWRQAVLPLSAVGAALVLKFRQEDRRDVLLIGLWVVGILVTAVAIPFTEQAVARAHGLIPIEVDLVRSLRYTVPIMLLFCLWPLVEISKKLESPRGRWVIAVVGALLVSVWTYSHQPKPALKALSCWERGKIVCPGEDEADQRIQALDAIRRLTPPGSHILPAERDESPRWLSIRYYALRPLVYSYKDGGFLAYTNHVELIRWYEKDTRMAAVSEEQDDEAKLEELVTLSREWGAQYLLADFGVDPTFASSLNVDVIYTNDRYTLILVAAPHARIQSLPDGSICWSVPTNIQTEYCRAIAFSQSRRD